MKSSIHFAAPEASVGCLSDLIPCSKQLSPIMFRRSSRSALENSGLNSGCPCKVRI